MEHRFTIPLVPVTKKNSQRIVRCGKYYRILPSKAYERYEKDCACFCNALHIDRPVNIMALYYMPTRRRVDLTNLNEALHDVLVTYKTIEDDNSSIVVSTDGSRVLYDKENPRTEVIITEV